MFGLYPNRLRHALIFLVGCTNYSPVSLSIINEIYSFWQYLSNIILYEVIDLSMSNAFLCKSEVILRLPDRKNEFKGVYDLSNLFGGPNGIRTRVTDVRGRCPRPLDDGTLDESNSNIQIPNPKQIPMTHARMTKRLIYQVLPFEFWSLELRSLFGFCNLVLLYFLQSNSQLIKNQGQKIHLPINPDS